MNIVNLGQEYYMVSFPSEEDQYMTLMDGPRLIYGNYLSVMEWIPNLCPTSDAIKQIVVWVIILGIPLEYYDA